MADREKVMRGLKEVYGFIQALAACSQASLSRPDSILTGYIENVQNALVLLKEQEARWIPIVSRPMDEEERKEWSERLGYELDKNEALIYISPLPDDGDEVITCDKYGNVTIDTFCEDEGCYFETPGDMDGIVAWMPKPHPYKPPKEEDDAEIY